MTPVQFRQLHGDPAKWTTADHDSYLVITETLSPPPPRNAAAETRETADHDA
ncbi:hypothetical protein ACWGDX_29640 [Streptomyces sp. NPDC055025]